MGLPDLINGTFEVSGALAVGFSIARTLRDKRVAGLSWLTVAFFTSWGLWNLFYYPSLEQWASYVGGVLLVIANAIWVGLIVFYTRHPESFGRNHYRDGRGG